MDASIRSRSLALSVLIHAALLLALIYWILKIPIPPFPEAGGGGGVLVNIGYIDLASGEIQPMSENISKDPQPVNVQPQAKSQDEKVVTQENEEAVAVNDVKRDVHKTIKNTASTHPVKETPKVPERKADKGSLYNKNPNSSKSQGTAATGTGDQGQRNGDPNSVYSGTGGGNGGTGSGPGEGGGTGSGIGKGFDWSLSGRTLLAAPQVDKNFQETGTIILDLKVDKQGNIIASWLARGSPSNSPELRAKAQAGLRYARFSPNPNGPDIQMGSMTFHFIAR